MQIDYDSDESLDPPGKSWETPEVEVLLVDQTELSSFAGFDGITSNS
jgi:hypothetical protein